MKTLKFYLPIFTLLFMGQLLQAQNNIHDADNDTRITTEAVADEDQIRFYLQGTQKWSMTPIGQFVPSNSSRNIRIGYNTGNSLTTGADNTFIGFRAGQTTTTASNNVGLGKYALQDNTTGYSNIALGTSTLANNTTGYSNMGIGTSSLLSNTTGRNNTAVGVGALTLNSTGLQNIAIGTNSLYKTTSSSNVGIGYQAGFNNTSGNNNILIGNKTGFTNSTGVHNTLIGASAGYLSTGSNNVFVGYQAGYNETASDKLYIDNSNTVDPLIYGDFSTNRVGINGRLGVGVENPSVLFDLKGEMVGGRLSEIEATNISSANDLFQLKVQSGATGSAQFIEFERGATVEARINTDGSAEFESADLVGKVSGSGDGNLILKDGHNTNFARITYKNNSGTDYWDQAVKADGANSAMNFWYHDGTSGSNIMTIDGADKRVGVGVTSPTHKFEVAGSSTLLKSTTTSAYHNIQSTHASGNAGLRLLTSAGATTGYIYYNNSSGDIRFYNQSSNDLVIEPDGTVGIGTTEATGANLVIGTGTGANIKVGSLLIEDLGSTNLGLAGDLVPHSSVAYDLGNNNATEHWDDVVGDDFINFSDRRLKRNINEISYGLADIMKLKPMQYQYVEKISVDGNTRFGLIAQDVEQVIPELIRDEDVDVDKTGRVIRTKTEYKAMNYVDLIPVLVKAIQEQQVVAEEKDEKIAKLEEKLNKIVDLDAKLAKLDAKFAKLDEMSDRLEQFGSDLQYCCSNATGSSIQTIPVKMDKVGEMPFVEQNAPNPFSAQTEIMYYIPRNANGGVMQITDRSGKVLKSISIQETGAGKVVLDANELAAGSYYYTFMVDGRIIDTKTMVLTK